MNLHTEGNILYITSIDISLPKGPSVNEREFCWSLNKFFGERVHFLITKPSFHVEEISRYNATYLSRWAPNNLASFISHQLELYKKAFELLPSVRPNLIVTRVGILPLGLFLFLRRCDSPCALKHLTGYPRGFIRVQQGIRNAAARFVAPLHEYLLSRIVEISIGADACTHGHIEGICKNLSMEKGRLILIENGTNTDRFKPGPRDEARRRCGLDRFDPILGFVGGRPWERGGTEMAVIAPRLISKFPNIGFVIVGGGKGMKPLTDLVSNSGLLDHFALPGIVPYTEVVHFINSFDAAIALDRTDNVDTIGNSNQKIRQYISCGKPVIASPGGSEFVVEKGLGSVVEPSDLEMVASEAIRWLSLTEGDKFKFEESAHAYAREHLSNDKLLKARIDFWNTKINGRLK